MHHEHIAWIEHLRLIQEKVLNTMEQLNEILV